MTNKDLVEDPQLNDRGLIVEWDQPEVGPRRYAGFPIHFSEWAPPDMRPTPALGQHNREILTELGFDDAAIDRMQSDGVIATTPHAQLAGLGSNEPAPAPAHQDCGLRIVPVGVRIVSGSSACRSHPLRFLVISRPKAANSRRRRLGCLLSHSTG